MPTSSESCKATIAKEVELSRKLAQSRSPKTIARWATELRIEGIRKLTAHDFRSYRSKFAVLDSWSTFGATRGVSFWWNRGVKRSLNNDFCTHLYHTLHHRKLAGDTSNELMLTSQNRIFLLEIRSDKLLPESDATLKRQLVENIHDLLVMFA
jgi:hypothetical protein